MQLIDTVNGSNIDLSKDTPYYTLLGMLKFVRWDHFGEIFPSYDGII